MPDINPSSLKVVDLRAELSKRGLPTKGKKDELVARLTEALEASESKTKEPQEESVVVEQEQVVAEEKSKKKSQSNDTILETQQKNTTTKESTEQLVKEQVIEKPAEQVIEKPAEQVIEEPEEQVIEKPEEQVVESSTEVVVEQSVQIVNDEPSKELEAQPTEKPQENLQEQLIEKHQEQLIEKPQEQLIEKPQEQLVQKPQEQSDNMDSTADSDLKRKRVDTDSNEDEKRLKTEDSNQDTAESSALYIKGFVRPLIIKHVQELLARYGTVKRFWMDSIKTHCYVTYETKLQAKEAFTNVDGIKFPADTGRLLSVGELTSEQADKLIKHEQNAAEKRIKVDWESLISRVQSGESLGLTSSAPKNDEGSRRFRSIGIGQITKQLAQAAEPASPLVPKPLPAIATKPKEISVDDLFRKTKSLPQLYYLPNTDQEAKMKLEKLQQR